MQYVDIIGIQMDLGASKRGVNMGPAAIRYAGLHEKLTEMGVAWSDKGDIIPLAQGKGSQDMKNSEQIIEANKRLYEEVLQTLSAGHMPIVLGGDHSVAAGSIPAVQKYFGEIGVIWIDAHGDFNDKTSTLSGNMHGMPFSAVCGQGPAEMVPYATGFVSPTAAAHIGARDIDIPERERMRKAGITVLSISEIDRVGISAAVEKAIAVASNGTKGIHVSFDLDAVTPEAAPGVGTPVHSGLTVREAFLTMEMLFESGKVLSVDMTEVNPILDQQNMTGNLACELILSLLGKRVF